MTVTRETSRSAPPKAAPTGRPMPLANAATEIRLVINEDVIRLVSTMPVFVLDRFFLHSAHELQFH